ncbi:MAG: sulfite exporter TauE/SafE family protein [Pseudomonadota bacterium]|nr:sulfite exporter TauE/SafE family protein [Pseudomonadota bacterium]
MNSLTFGGGLMLGLASSLHCAGMCGGIATSLMFGFGPQRARSLFAAQAGKILVYIMAGAAAGAAGSVFYGAFHHPAAFLAMRAAAALSLGWIGFSLLGLAPSLAGIDRLSAPVARAVSRLRAPGTALAAGMVWGFLPCGLVYGALFYAGLSGGPLDGAAVMTGFGLGTLPSVSAVALGAARFRALAHAPGARVAVGLGLMGLAAASLAAPAAVAGIFCRP